MPPVRFGLTADTGGHIAYVLSAAAAQAGLREVDRVSIVTRLFEDEQLGHDYARPQDRLDGKTTIDRVATGNRLYLEKEALLLDLPDFTAAFCRHLERLPQRPDVIHAHFADAASVALAARARYGIPFVYNPHALGIDKRNRHGGGGALDARIGMERAAITAADAIIVSTRNEMEQQIAAYGVADAARRLWHLAPGIPLQSTQPERATVAATLERTLHDSGKPMVLAIARPVRKKNLAGLVRAYAATPGLKERANLVILAGQHGAGLLSHEEMTVVEELKALCGTRELHGRVAMPPTHDSADVAALYRMAANSGVFVNPAFHEPFGLTLIEAAAAGLPVVATRCGGPADIIAATGHGVLIDPADEAAIGAACLRIVSNGALHDRLSRAGLENAARFSWPLYAERAVSLYASLCRKPREMAAA